MRMLWHRDYHRVPLRRLTKRELRKLVVDMRLRHDDEINRILRLLPPETALKVLMERT